jgi:hypothetical protein
MGQIRCLTVRVKPEHCDILLLFENLNASNLIDEIQKSLSAEYRDMNDVAEWCFHTDDHSPYPGDFGHCKIPGGRDKWLLDQASKVFGWQ